MNYRLLSKKKYWPEKFIPISLVEFMLFNDVSTDQKFVITKYHNHTNSLILDATFDIHEISDTNHIIRTSTYSYENLNVNGFKGVVPQLKLKVHPQCVRVESELFICQIFNKSLAGWCMAFY